jgi:exosortase E/protease (VPEID-CTERM system)
MRGFFCPGDYSWMSCKYNTGDVALDEHELLHGPLAGLRRIWWWHIGLLGALFVLQFELVEMSLRAYFDLKSGRASIWAPFFDYRHVFFGFCIVFPVLFTLLVWPRGRRHVSQLETATHAYNWLPRLAAQLLAYFCFALLTFILSVHPEALSGATTLALLLWLMAFLATVGFSLLALAPGHYWRYVLLEERTSLVLAVATTLLATGFTIWLRDFTPTLAFWTLHGSYHLLSLFFDPLIFDVADRTIGTGNFLVRVSNDCAGYEGISLIAIFLSVYLWVFRKDFRFPWALLAYPVGLCAVFAFNVIRVSVLIGIGDSGSPTVATTGFHSNAGWIAFLAVFVGLIYLLHTAPLFSRSTVRGGSAGPAKQPGLQAETVSALLMPLAVLFASILLLGAFSTDFDALYPFKVISTAIAIWVYRPIYRFSEYTPSLPPVLIGVLVFIVWMLLVPHSAEHGDMYAQQFSQWPPTLVAAWLVFRVLGSVVTVPLAEELAFRGYLLSRLGGETPGINTHICFSLYAFLVSSLLFGLIHGDWLAGTVAGMAYAWVRYRGSSVFDAVIAHMTTNGMLSAYVLLTQQWGYW